MGRKRPTRTRVSVGSSGVNGPVGNSVIFCFPTLARCRLHFTYLPRTFLTAEFQWENKWIFLESCCDPLFFFFFWGLARRTDEKNWRCVKLKGVSLDTFRSFSIGNICISLFFPLVCHCLLLAVDNFGNYTRLRFLTYTPLPSIFLRSRIHAVHFLSMCQLVMCFMHLLNVTIDSLSIVSIQDRLCLHFWYIFPDSLMVNQFSLATVLL